MKKRLFESIDTTGEFSRSKAYADYVSLVDEISRIADKSAAGGEYPDSFYHTVEMYVKYGNFTKLGKGSSRTAFTFDADNRYVLKFAHNENGLKQNQTEIKNAKLGKGDYSCMVRILAYDPRGVFIVEDACRQSTYDEWYRVIGITPNMLSKIVRLVLERRESNPGYTVGDFMDDIRDPSAAERILVKTSAMDDNFNRSDHAAVMTCLGNLVKAANNRPVAEKWKAMYDLFRFYFDNGMGAMIPEELLYTDQWGIKPGKTPDEDVMLIIDPGVDSDFMPFVGKNGRVGGDR